MSHDHKEFRNHLSDWSELMIDGKSFDAIFKISDMPVSWFIRPILFSSLLPAPFTKVSDFVYRKAINQNKQIVFSSLFKQAVALTENLRYMLRSKTKPKKFPRTEFNTNNKEKVAFFSFTNYYDQNNIPFRERAIIQKIREDNRYDAFTLAVEPLSLFSPAKLFKIENTIYDYYDEEIWLKSKQLARNLSNSWKNISAGLLSSYFKYEGQDSYSYFQENFNFLYSHQFLTMLYLYYLTFLKILSEQCIKLVVLSSQNSVFEKCLIAAAGALKTPVLVLQHGVALGKLPTLDTPNHVSYALFGDFYRRELLNLKIEEPNLFVTGPLIFEGIEGFIQPLNKLDRKVNSNFINILFATSPLIEDNYLGKKEYFGKIDIILRELKLLNANVIIKLHPRERYISYYRKLARSLNLNLTFSQVLERKEHYALISNSGLVISFGSTVALEAMIIGRPTLTIEMFDQVNPTNDVVRESGVTTVVRYNSPIAQVVMELSRTKVDSSNFVKDICSVIDGKSSLRITQVIYDLIERQRNLA